jgi:two-component system chemotaxis sensor kinase CheA
MRSKRISRQWSRAFGAEVLEENLLSCAPRSGRGSEAEVQALLDQFFENLPAFLNSVDEMYSQLDERAVLAQRSLELSSAELTAANTSLFGLNQTFDAVLNSLGQGFLLFGRDGMSQSIFSKACETLLEANPANKHVADILKLPEEKRAPFSDWFELLFQGMMDFEDLAPLGPRYFQHSQKWVVQLEFKPVRNAAGDVEFVLMIATDLTKEVQATEKAQEVQAFANFVAGILRNKARFLSFVDDFRAKLSECHSLIGAAPDANASYLNVKSLLHGLKGASGLFGMLKVERALHSLESAVVQLQSARESLAVLLPELEAAGHVFESILAENEDILGDLLRAVGPQRQVPLSSLKSFESELAKAGLGDLRAKFADSFIAEPVFQVLGTFNSDLQQTAKKLGKAVAPIDFCGENFLFQKEAYADVLSDLVHVFRNIADHGIENPAARQAAGKNPVGKVIIASAMVGFDLQIDISDDGAGINEASLARKLEGRGIKVSSREQLLDSIFQADISTSNCVTDISGRGVGLYALRSSIRAIGGAISVSSKPGLGTSFRITLPLVGK